MGVRKKVYVTRKLPGPALSMLSKQCDVTVHKGTMPPTRNEILKRVSGKDGILCTLSDRIDEEVMDAAGPSLQIISSYSTGFEHIDVGEATKRGIYVAYTSDVLAETTADLAFALILACARNIVQCDIYVREKKWKGGWTPDLMLGFDVHGMTLGIIGLGSIGSAVARRARGFDMNIIYHSIKRNLQVESELGLEYVGLSELLKQSDFVSIHATLNEDSIHLIDGLRLSKMKKTAFIINTARGQIINQKDLVNALKNGQIAGAGLDVFEHEPLSSSDELVRLKNVVLLPHVGSATHATREKMSNIAAQNLLNVLNDIDPIYLVNPEVKKIRSLTNNDSQVSR